MHLDQEAERWGPAPATGGRRGYLVAMAVAIVLTLAGIAYLASSGGGTADRDMPGMDMDASDM